MRDLKSWVPAWLAFLAAGTFFTFMTPVGEGIDEPAHFAYVQHVAETGTVPLGRTRSTSQEIDVFLRSQPVGRSLVDTSSSLHTHEDYWKRSDTDREAADRVVAGLHFSGDYLEPLNAAVPLYESHQPPLYYIVAAPVFRAASQVLTFADTLLLTRLWSVLLASLTIPGAFLLARTLLKDVAAAESVLVLIVLFPGFYPGIVRVTNDALAVPLACWAFYFLISYLQTERKLLLFGLSALVTAGLWTKAFFFPVLFAAVLTLLIYRKGKAAAALLLISAFGLPWYAMTFMQTGAVTGLPETVAAKTSIASSVEALWSVDWTNAMRVLNGSHIWIGNSSLLGVRRWMPQLISSLFIFGVAGLLVRARRSGLSTMVPLILGYAIFAAALAYYATQVFQQTGTSVIQGWYLTMFIPVEAILFVAGARGWFKARWNWLAATFAVFLFALLVYTALFVALPYYAGIRGDFVLATKRLLRFTPAVPLWLPWLALLGVTSFAVFGITRMGSKRRETSESSLDR